MIELNKIYKEYCNIAEERLNLIKSNFFRDIEWRTDCHSI